MCQKASTTCRWLRWIDPAGCGMLSRVQKREGGPKVKDQSKPLDELVKMLPPEMQREVSDFVYSLLQKRPPGKVRRKPSFEWAGALRDLRDRYSSVELQHKISEWRIGER